MPNTLEYHTFDTVETMHTRRASSRRYVLISPCRDEAQYVRRTLESVIVQREKPIAWVIVDDGSTDETPAILKEYASRHDWIRVVQKPDRGYRAVGLGVIEAFYAGLASIEDLKFDYICKLDLDLELPLDYFSILMNRMDEIPRLGSASGKPYFRNSSGRWISEKCGDELSVGMTKFYRYSCFKAIGGFVRQVMWDAIDCHKARQMGWIARSWDEPGLRFEHLRPMGSSGKGILSGRQRHGFGQYFMGSDPLYFLATALYRMAHPPYVIGGLAMIFGYTRAALASMPRHEDAALRRFIQAYQRRALLVGKARAIAEIEHAMAPQWQRLT